MKNEPTIKLSYTLIGLITIILIVLFPITYPLSKLGRWLIKGKIVYWD